MARNVRLGTATIAIAIGALAVAGCGRVPVECPAIVADIVATATPGSTIDVKLTNVIPGCNSEHKWVGADTVTLTLVSVDTREAELASGSGQVTADGTATVSLAIPADATGRVSVEQDGYSLGTVTITD